MRVVKIYCCTCVMLYVLWGMSCNGAGIKSVNATAQIVHNDTLRYLDNNNRNVEQVIDEKTILPEKYKFVQVEITKVYNPKKIPVIFQIDYQLNDNKIFLGTFSLYPADNPGKFIVATQGKLKNEGSIVLSMSFPIKTEIQDTVLIELKKIKLFDKK